MGKGGGAPPAPTQTESTVTQTNLPEYVQPFFENVLERTEAESLRPYQTFPGQRLARFSPEQQESFDVASRIARAGVPGQLGAATQRLEQAAAFNPGYTPGTFSPVAGTFSPIEGAISPIASPGEFTPGSFVAPGVAQQYMNPFIENVIDVQQRRARRQFDEDVAPRLAADAVGRGAFGSSRFALSEAAARNRLEERLGDIEGTQRAQAFREATGAFEQDRQAQLRAEALREQFAAQEAKTRLQAEGLEAQTRLQAESLEAQTQLRAEGLREQAAQQQARLGIAGEQIGLRAAPALAALGAQEQALGLRGADVLRQVGEQERALEQQQLDVALSDFLSQRDFPRQQLAYYGGILHGVPVSPVSEVSQFQAQPSTGQQMLGYGLGGLGLARSVMGA